MKIENPIALNYILEDEVYLLDKDRHLFAGEISPDPQKVQATKVDFSYLGKNNQRFLVLVHYLDHEFIPGDHLMALENILKRKSLSIDDIAIVNLHYTQVKIEALFTYFEPAKLLILGEKALPAGLNNPMLNQAGKTADKDFLYSFGFDEMMDSTDKKKLFWEQMKSF